jgi:hypothetical protein
MSLPASVISRSDPSSVSVTVPSRPMRVAAVLDAWLSWWAVLCDECDVVAFADGVVGVGEVDLSWSEFAALGA